MKLPGLYRKSDSKIFYYQPPQIDGVRPNPVNLQTKDEEEAIEAYYQAKAQIFEQFKRGTLRQEVARFLQERRQLQQHRAGSSEETRRVLAAAVTALGNREVSRISADDLKALHRTWLKKGLSAATVAAYVARLRSFFAWAVTEKLIRENPAKTLPKSRDTIPTRSERYCMKEEREKLIAALPAARPDLALVLWLGFFAGLRRREIDQARRDWVDLEAGVLRVQRTETFEPKTARGVRIIRLSPRLHAFLADYLSRPPVKPRRKGKDGKILEAVVGKDWQPDDFLLRPDKRMGRKVRGRGKKANRYRYDARRPLEEFVDGKGLGWVGFHTMRHTWATLHAMANTPMATLAKELGEKADTTFHHYVGYQRQGGHAEAID